MQMVLDRDLPSPLLFYKSTSYDNEVVANMLSDKTKQRTTKDPWFAHADRIGGIVHPIQMGAVEY